MPEIEISIGSRKTVERWLTSKLGNGSENLVVTGNVSEMEKVWVYEVDGEPLVMTTDEYIGLRTLYVSEGYIKDLQEAGIIDLPRKEKH